MWVEGSLILDEYEVVRPLGSGGMATAYLVRHVDRGKLLAVKVPHRRLVESPEDRMIFAQEVQVWVGLPRHPHIVQCHFVREVEGTPVVFAEYVPSGTLASWTTRGRIHGLAHVLDLGIQLAEAMSVAQRFGVVHRDLKPANCLMDDAGLLKVGDFGVASARVRTERRRENSVPADARQRVPIAGTPAYCSPEQYDGRQEDGRTDIWSFGVTLFEILTRRLPALGPAAPCSVRRYRAGCPDSTVPGAMWDLLLDLLEPDLSRRPDSFAEVVSRLRGLYAAVTGREYARRFPEPSKLPEEPSVGRGPRARAALGHLKQALAFDGRDSAEAERFEVTIPGGPRSEEADLLAAVALLNEAARIYREAPPAASPEQRLSEWAAVLHAAAEAQRRLGNLAAAVTAYGEAAAQLQALFRRRPTPDLAIRLVAVIQDRAVCHRRSGNVAQAVADYDNGIAVLTRLDAPRIDPSLDGMLANLYQNRAMALFKARRLDDAMADAERSVELRERLVGELGRSEFAADLAGAYCNRGVLHRNMGDTRAARSDCDRALQLCERPEAGGPSSRTDEILAMIFLNRGAVEMAEHDYLAAAKDTDRAVEVLERLTRDSPGPEQLLNLSLAYNNRAEALAHLGNLDGAQADADRSIRLREQLVDRWGMDNLAGALASAYRNKAMHMIERGDSSGALPLVERAVASFESHVRRKGRADLVLELSRLRAVRGLARSSTGSPDEGLEDLSTAIREMEGLLPEGAAEVFDGLTQALSLCVMAHHAVAAGFDATVPRNSASWDRAWDRSDPRRRGELLRLARSALTRMRDSVAQGGVFPAYLAPRLRALGATLAPVARMSPDAGAADIASIIGDLLRSAAS